MIFQDTENNTDRDGLCSFLFFLGDISDNTSRTNGRTMLAPTHK